MLDTRRDDVIPRANQARNGEIVGLRTAAGENNLRSAAAEQRGHPLACVLYRCPGLLPVMVDGGGVSELIPEIGPHRLEHFGQDRGGGVIVEVNAMHTEPASILPCRGRSDVACTSPLAPFRTMVRAQRCKQRLYGFL